MKHPDQHCVNVSEPEELAYWSRILDVSPSHILHAVKVTGSNLVNRMVWFLKAEGLLPGYFDIGKVN